MIMMSGLGNRDRWHSAVAAEFQRFRKKAVPLRSYWNSTIETLDRADGGITTLRSVGKYLQNDTAVTSQQTPAQFSSLPSSVSVRPKYYRKTSFIIAMTFLRVRHSDVWAPLNIEAR